MPGRLVVLVVLFVVAGCGNGDGGDAAPESETIDLSRLVVVGDSVAAGVRSGVIDAETQRDAFPGRVAAQAGADLPLPLLEPGRLDPDRPFRVNPDVQARNLAVPGADVRAALAARPARPLDSLLDLVLGLPGLDQGLARSQVEWAEALRPTAVLLFLGNNDVLGAATSGDPGRATPLESFTRDMTAVIGRLAATGAPLVVATIPDVTRVAYLTPAETFAERVGQSLDAIGGALGLAAGDRLTPQGVAAATARLAGAADGPVPSDQVLTAAEAAKVRETVERFNAVIRREAGEVGAALVDVHALLDRAADEGIPAGDARLTTAQGGGVFSLDGLHPTRTAQAILANAFIEAINARFAARIPLVDVAAVAARDPMAPPGRAGGAPGGVRTP
ncbi:MAG TPA: SGNH/GDSL hydrolase family protein [Thermodesulfobacteriota bacterium]